MAEMLGRAEFRPGRKIDGHHAANVSYRKVWSADKLIIGKARIEPCKEMLKSTTPSLRERRNLFEGYRTGQGSALQPRSGISKSLLGGVDSIPLDPPQPGFKRWLTTAFLIRINSTPDWRDVPDITTLPEASWLPILVRCRDLPPNTATLNDVLYNSLRKLELSEDECDGLLDLLRDKLKQGTGLLLVDGLDEITEPAARVRFSHQLAQIHRVYPDTPMVVTSRGPEP